MKNVKKEIKAVKSESVSVSQKEIDIVFFTRLARLESLLALFAEAFVKSMRRGKPVWINDMTGDRECNEIKKLFPAIWNESGVKQNGI